MKIHTFRLKPGNDRKVEIEKFIKAKNIQAGFIVTCVGRLNQAVMRMAGGHLKEGTVIHPTAEVVIGEDEDGKYTRELDEETGFPELVVWEKRR